MENPQNIQKAEDSLEAISETFPVSWSTGALGNGLSPARSATLSVPPRAPLGQAAGPRPLCPRPSSLGLAQCSTSVPGPPQELTAGWEVSLSSARCSSLLDDLSLVTGAPSGPAWAPLQPASLLGLLTSPGLASCPPGCLAPCAVSSRQGPPVPLGHPLCSLQKRELSSLTGRSLPRCPGSRWKEAAPRTYSRSPRGRWTAQLTRRSCGLSSRGRSCVPGSLSPARARWPVDLPGCCCCSSSAEGRRGGRSEALLSTGRPAARPQLQYLRVRVLLGHRPLGHGVVFRSLWEHTLWSCHPSGLCPSRRWSLWSSGEVIPVWTHDFSTTMYKCSHHYVLLTKYL